MWELEVGVMQRAFDAFLDGLVERRKEMGDCPKASDDSQGGEEEEDDVDHKVEEEVGEDEEKDDPEGGVGTRRRL